MTQSSLHFSAFIAELKCSAYVFTLYDKDGIPCPVGDGGVRSMPFWSSENRAALIVKNVIAYAGMQVKAVPKDDFIRNWLPELKRDNLNVGCNWSGKKATGYDCAPDAILEMIKVS